MRIDKWLRRQYPGLVQGIIEKNLRLGRIKVQGKKVPSSYQVLEDTDIFLDEYFKKYLLSSCLPEHLAFKKKLAAQRDFKQFKETIIFEDNHLCVINKPYGLPTQGGTKISKHVDLFLPLCGKEWRLVHRLDKKTTGVLLIAKSLEMAIHLGKILKEGRAEKSYWAIVHGHLKELEGSLNFPLRKGVKDEKEKMLVCYESGKEALSYYKVFQPLGRDYSWVNLIPKTGRMHQLRVHMAHIGHPIVGDTKYGRREENHPRLYLHAHSITIPNLNFEPLTFIAPPPHHIKRFLGKFYTNKEEGGGIKGPQKRI